MKQHWITLIGSILILIAAFSLWQYGVLNKMLSIILMASAEIAFILLVRYHFEF